MYDSTIKGLLDLKQYLLAPKHVNGVKRTNSAILVFNPKNSYFLCKIRIQFCQR